MTEVRGLSDFWRCDRSDDLVSELASVLQGADTLIGNMGSDIRVTWSGADVSYTDFQRRIVALDYGPLMGKECPFAGTLVDEVIGYAAHEGGHCLWSVAANDQAIRRSVLAQWERLPDSLRRDWQSDEEATLAEMCRIHNLLEDAYTDHRVTQRWPVLGEYIRIARAKLLQRTPVDIEAIARAERPDRNAFMNLWLSVSLYAQPLPASMSAPVSRATDALLALTDRARGKTDVAARQGMAIDAAIVLWQEFPAGKARPRTQQEAAGGAPGQAGSQASEPGNLDDFDPAPRPGQRGRKVVSVPGKLLDRIAEATSNGTKALSQPVAQTLAEDPRQVAATVRKAHYDPGRAITIMSQVRQESREVQRTFQRQQDLSSRWLHGLERGKLDSRRLWKPFAGDPACYKRKDTLGRPSLAVGLLLDASGSMSSYARVAEQAAAVFFQGLRDISGLDFAAWCYTGQLAQVTLTRLCDRELPGLCLARVDKGGDTPSGAAIAAAKLLLERMLGKRKLLIHFTDGRPDSAAHVQAAVKACRDAGIHTYAIGLVRNSDMLARQYGDDNYETIQAVPELPQAVGRIVRKIRCAPTGYAGPFALGHRRALAA